MTFDAIVPAGGRASRLGGIVKPLLTIDGVTLLDLALSAAAGARRLVVVGPPELPVPTGVTLVREDPPFGGPVAAVATGMTQLPADPADWVLVLAADLPRAGELVTALLAAAQAFDADRPDALVGVDAAGRKQWLAGLYGTVALAAALDDVVPAGLAMRELVADLTIAAVRLPDNAIGDVDTPVDAAEWNALD